MQIEKEDAIIIENAKDYKKIKNKSNLKIIYVGNNSSSNNEGIMRIDCFSRMALLIINYSDSLNNKNDD
jgi:hypothetical protein